MPVVLWWQGPGPLAPRLRAVGTCTSASTSSPSRAKTCVGRPRAAWGHAIGSAAHGGKPRLRSWSRLPGSWARWGGPWPSRSP